MNYLYLLLVILVCFLLYHVEWYPTKVVDITYINMERDEDRKKFMETQLAQLGIPYRRWVGIDASLFTTEEMKQNHVGSPSFAIRHNHWDKKMRNTGVIGCWLAHKTLLQDLATQNAKNNAAHLILEDDIHVPPNLMARWPAIQRDLPRDWDMLFFGLTQPVIQKQINASIGKLEPGHGNWGAYAYAVRHGSIKTKILPCLTWFRDPIDDQYDICFDSLNAYVITPQLLHSDSEFQDKSSIDKAL
jgi:GR25 family glycosyltransferase involved in LPS biosynthesis